MFPITINGVLCELRIEETIDGRFCWLIESAAGTVSNGGADTWDEAFADAVIVAGEYL